MTTQGLQTSVATEIVVPAPAERAFQVFTEMGTWWPRGHHVIEPGFAETVLEPFEGGRVYDRGVDGDECCWARVIAFEPPSRILLRWELTPQWQVEDDPDRCSEVEVRFIAEGPDRTRVELEHRELQRHGEGWEGKRDAVGSDGGWPEILRSYAGRFAA